MLVMYLKLIEPYMLTADVPELFLMRHIISVNFLETTITTTVVKVSLSPVPVMYLKMTEPLCLPRISLSCFDEAYT